MNSNPRLVSNLSRHTLLLLLVGILAACNPPASSNNTSASVASPEPARALEMVAPESVGMDSQRLNRVKEAMQDLVDQGLLAGAVTMAARDNKVMHFESVGYRDKDAEAAMTNDALFRIYSMTKPITGVALMTLYEEGKFKLSDPVEKYIPEMKDLTVYVGTNDDG